MLITLNIILNNNGKLGMLALYGLFSLTNNVKLLAAFFYFFIQLCFINRLLLYFFHKLYKLKLKYNRIYLFSGLL